jgi:DNA ligase-1
MTTVKPFRPMRAGDITMVDGVADLSTLTFPVLASPKIDGIRCLITADGPVTRSLKPIRNDYIRERLSKLPVGFDGEITVGKITSGTDEGDSVMNRTSSGVMSKDGAPDFIYHVFDDFTASGGYAERLNTVGLRFLEAGKETFTYSRAVPLPHPQFANADELAAYEAQCVADGYEGIMIRSVDGPYKYGESTTKEGYLLKWKRWKDAEAWVIGALEEMANNNEAKKNALGLTERSTHKANKTPKGVLGKLECMWYRPPPGADPNAVFEIGSGFTKEQRAEFWQEHLLGGGCIRDRKGTYRWPPKPPEEWLLKNGDSNLSGLAGRLVRFRYQEITPDGVPRFQVFDSFRHIDDLPPEG